MSRIIVKNLPKSITDEQLRKHFAEKGEITDVQLKYTSNGVFRQFGFVGYKTEKEANEAITYFNNTFINTNRINVKACANLGDTQKPKSWSKYAADSEAYKKKHGDEKSESVSNLETKSTQIKNQNKRNLKELIEKYKNDSMFEIFMELHGTKDLNILLNKLKETEIVLNANIKNKTTVESDEIINNEENKESEEKLANEKISDLDYMKLLMAKSVEKKSEPRKRMEKQPKQKIKLYTVKLLGLPYTCKKKDLKQFFRPLVPYTIRIPVKTKGFAYVGFKTEKTMNQALNKNRSFIGDKQITVIKYVSKEEAETIKMENSNVNKKKWIEQEEALKNEEDIAESGRIFLRNLSYTTTEDDVQKLFEKYGPVTEVNLPLDQATRKLKGFGVITFLMPEHAVKAYSELDGTILHGRLLHLLPAKAKHVAENLEDLSYKEKKALKLKSEANSSHNWNTLFMGQNAVAEIIADTYGTSKSNVVLDDRGKSSAAVRLALGETQIVSQMKQFLEENGVSLDVFNMNSMENRSKTVMLVKNLPAQTEPYEIQQLFAPFGLIARVVLPPNGITALVEFMEPYEARKAFTKLAYTKFKSAPLYLEWAPENVFKTAPKIKTEENVNEKEKEINLENIEDEEKKDPDEDEEDEEPEPDTTLFVKNLNFATSEDSLRKHFESCGKINYVTIATRKNPENSKKKLSMGYGFVRFQHKTGADKALKTLQQSVLDDMSLELKRSERTLQSELKTTKKKLTVKTKQTSNKILVKNVPFEAKRHELLELFKAFGEIKSLRLPKKLTLGSESHRGFAFVEFATKGDAKRAFEALSSSTHLYGRRLVLEWAATENDGVEQIRKRTAQHFHPENETQKTSKKGAIDTETFINSST